jgi:hypothetical protein
MSVSKFLTAAALSVGVLAAVAPAHATTLAPFATYSMTGTKTTIDWSKSGATGGSIFSTVGGGSSLGSPTVTFNFLDTSLYLNNLSAKFTLTGTAPSGNPASNAVLQPGIGTAAAPGSFSFIYTGPNTSFMGKNYVSGVTNLLSGVYTLAQISGSGTSGSFHDSDTIGTLSFTSDIITNLPTAVTQDFSLSLVSINPKLGYTPGQSLNSFKSGATGIFSAGFVPEPATWAMMIVGFGMLGLAARRRRSLAHAAI